jgi:DNA-binding NarL/FixJ family response regulator
MIGSVFQTCVVIDDSPEFLAAATRLLEAQGVAVLGCASSRARALELAAAEAPDVALVDVELGDEDGVELAAELAGVTPPTRVVLISARDQDDLPLLLNGSGAAGFLPKTALGVAAIAELLG